MLGKRFRFETVGEILKLLQEYSLAKKSAFIRILKFKREIEAGRIYKRQMFWAKQTNLLKYFAFSKKKKMSICYTFHK